jgi:hypothetical protein
VGLPREMANAGKQLCSRMRRHRGRRGWRYKVNQQRGRTLVETGSTGRWGWEGTQGEGACLAGAAEAVLYVLTEGLYLQVCICDRMDVC